MYCKAHSSGSPDLRIGMTSANFQMRYYQCLLFQQVLNMLWEKPENAISEHLEFKISELFVLRSI